MGRQLLVCGALISCWFGGDPFGLTKADGNERNGQQWQRPLGDEVPDLFVWTDTCNVYVLRDGQSAILIDLGNGSVLDHLTEIGVQQVEWVVFTHHHREQCQGAPRLAGSDAQVAAPESERAFFERPNEFRKLDVRLSDPYTIHGSSCVRPPVEPLSVDRALKSNESFVWRGMELRCVETPGNSPGSMTYILRKGKHILAFSGDVMLNDARMHTWFDTEWDYGFAAGIRALRKTVTELATLDVSSLLPAHGPPVPTPAATLAAYGEKLARLEQLYVRGYGEWAHSPAFQDNVSQPTPIADVVQVSPHLFKFKRPDFWPNFGLILADNGHALVVDCGLLEESFLDASLEGMRKHFGLKAIDAVIITHMHGDHFLDAPHLRDRWGAPIWALDNMVDKMEHPEWFDYAAPVQGYGKLHPDGSPMTGVLVDRAFKPGETFVWEGQTFTIDWMPGQTEFALCLHGTIDGRKVAFTGDNIFGNPEDPNQTGHEAVVAHNSAILEEGYIYAGEYLKRLAPDILIGGHSFVMDRPAAFIERYRTWSYAMRDAFQSLSSEEHYQYWFDPFWLRAEPYRIRLRPGEGTDSQPECPDL
jgi:glyoxylase-like metal-dependent hydrolase (beta-lactamase superfamily II)